MAKVVLVAATVSMLAGDPLHMRKAHEGPPKPVLCSERCWQGKVDVLNKRIVRINRRSVGLERQRNNLRRTLDHRGSITEALNLACSTYGNCATLWRRARCESGLSAFARNPSGASGLLQFLPSTWASTPFARFSIWSPYAQALAGGWMIGPAGRGGEWSCR